MFQLGGVQWNPVLYCKGAFLREMILAQLEERIYVE